MLKSIPRSSLVAMIPLGNYSLAMGALGLAVLSYALLRRKPTSPDEVERKRRVWLTRVGRITDGTVIDVQELPPGTRRAATMLIYQYDVAGVGGIDRGWRPRRFDQRNVDHLPQPSPHIPGHGP